ncbi:MAG: thioredoxin [Candidatus Uhrbacteria bacterium]|nr:thioredoxin [Patescibacteria group bacterium]MBU1906869.1 thioredoxin [Patescibacteria group bacterium]
MDVTKETFQAEVLQSESPVLVDFWAPWCGPCKMMGPIVEEIAKEMDGKFKVVKLNVDETQDLAQEYSILSIPTFMVFKGGQVVDQFAGAMSKDALKEKISSHL